MLGESGPEDVPGAEATLKVYVSDVAAGERMPAIAAALAGLAYRQAQRTIREEDWAESWKRFWHALRIGERLVVRPSWEEYDPADREVVIVLDPKQAFGTGTHPTTRLVLAAIEHLVRPGDVVYDVGAGSGILAVAAVLLGAARAEGVDTDPVAVAACEENAALNRVADRCAWRVGSAAELSGGADLVVANILAEVIVQLAPDLARLCGRDLVVSGIIARKAGDTRVALEAAGLGFVSQDQEGDWVAQVFSRQG